MGHMRRWRYRAWQKDIKHSSSAGRGELPLPPFACGKCGFQGMDAYDLSCHLRDNNYCGAGNVAAFATASNTASSTILEDSSSSGDDNEPPLEEGDSFMYNDDPSLENNKVARLGQPKIGIDSGSLSSHDNGHVTSVSSASSHCDVSELSDHSSDYSESVGSESPNEYEFYEETSFPAGVDDVVHVGLVDLCRRIKAPLYAYNEILHWAQDAKVQGFFMFQMTYYGLAHQTTGIRHV